MAMLMGVPGLEHGLTQSPHVYRWATGILEDPRDDWCRDRLESCLPDPGQTGPEPGTRCPTPPRLVEPGGKPWLPPELELDATLHLAAWNHSLTAWWEKALPAPSQTYPRREQVCRDSFKNIIP